MAASISAEVMSRLGLPPLDFTVELLPLAKNASGVFVLGTLGANEALAALVNNKMRRVKVLDAMFSSC